jgi:hypothetical protein
MTLDFGNLDWEWSWISRCWIEQKLELGLVLVLGLREEGAVPGFFVR